MNLGVLLLEFLQLYGHRLNYETTGISVRDGGRYYNKADKYASYGYEIMSICVCVRGRGGAFLSATLVASLLELPVVRTTTQCQVHVCALIVFPYTSVSFHSFVRPCCAGAATTTPGRFF